jgi:hypothetical protein
MALWKLFARRAGQERAAAMKVNRIPTVRFDPAKVTDKVKADLRANIRALDDVAAQNVEAIYEVAVQSISRGGDLSVLCDALIAIDGQTKQRATEISRLLNNKATALMEDERRIALGITHAVWLYSGAPCGNHDAEHKGANGASYRIGEGLLIGGAWTSPGREAGCQCVSRSVIEGFT